MQFILASKSPRRAQLLNQVGLQFKIIPSHIDESIHLSANPVQAVRQIALAKAQSVAENQKTGIIIGADTIVVSNRKIVGKPKDKSDARRLLNQLSGRTHQVITGVAVIDARTKRKKVSHCITSVRFRKLTKPEIDAYIATGDPFDKAGAYGIQGKGALFIEKINGDYFNVVGLPLVLLMKLINKMRKFE
ncbi:MAG: Maf family protein [bacterium]|nr:Maf family protein [bacterium]